MSQAPFDHERDKPLTPSSVISRFAQTYLVMAALGLLSCAFLNQNLGSLFRLPVGAERWGYFAALTSLGVGLIAAAQELCKQLFPTYAAQRQAMARALGPLSLSQVAYLALLSAGAEELLFRGALQDLLGVATTSLALALLHPRSAGDGLPTAMMLMTLILSLTLGCLYQYSNSLYPGLVVHLILNAAFLLRHTPAGPRLPDQALYPTPANANAKHDSQHPHREGEPPL